MSIFKRNFFVQAPVLGLLAIAAACGGGEQTGEQGAETAATDPAAVTPAATAEQSGAAATAPTGDVIEVKMVTTQGGASGEFQPSQITAKKGDVIRFVMADGQAAHNVNFQVQENAGKTGLPGPSQYLTQVGQTVDVPVTMDAGTYDFQCDPHAAMGMKGKLTVTQ
jgi:plastocyanin